MLTLEAAREMLKQHQIPDIQQRWLEAIPTLPAALRPIAYGLLGRDGEGQPPPHNPFNTKSYERAQAFTRMAQLRFVELTETERAALFTLFLPTLVPQAALTWEYMEHGAFDTSRSGGFFRAPGHPHATDQVRLHWFQRFLMSLGSYHETPLWLAEMAGYFNYYDHELSVFLAAVIDRDAEYGDRVFDTLLRTVRQEENAGLMGHSAIAALLAASRPSGWEAVERLLLAAQREEGLRHTILSALPLAHPQARVHLLRLIRDNDLARFSSVALILGEWLGYEWDATQVKTISACLDTLLSDLQDPAARQQAINTGDPQALYLALWALATEDANRAIQQGQQILSDADPARRFAALRLLSTMSLPAIGRLALQALSDPDERVMALACEWIRHHEHMLPQLEDAFASIAAALPRLPKIAPAETTSITGWKVHAPTRSQIADRLISCVPVSAPDPLLAYVAQFTEWGQVHATELLLQANPNAEAARQLVLRTQVRNTAISGVLM